MSSRLFLRLLPISCLLVVLVAPSARAEQQDITSVTGQVNAAGEYAAAKVPGAVPFVRTELFFGTSRPDGLPPVTDEEFRSFLDQEITPRFPDGLTLVGALGQFRNSSGVIVQERSLLLILLYPAETQKASSRRIERIRTIYKRLFQQESVLRVDDPRPVLTSF
jgi:hypothetical protein